MPVPGGGTSTTISLPPPPPRLPPAVSSSRWPVISTVSCSTMPASSSACRKAAVELSAPRIPAVPGWYTSTRPASPGVEIRTVPIVTGIPSGRRFSAIALLRGSGQPRSSRSRG